MTFPTAVDLKKYSDEELTTMLAEAGEASNHARKRGKVMGIVAAHRLEQMKEILLYNDLAIWRRENGFDRVEAVEKNGLVTTARFRPPRSNTMLSCGQKWTR